MGKLRGFAQWGEAMGRHCAVGSGPPALFAQPSKPAKRRFVRAYRPAVSFQSRASLQS